MWQKQIAFATFLFMRISHFQISDIQDHQQKLSPSQIYGIIFKSLAKEVCNFFLVRDDSERSWFEVSSDIFKSDVKTKIIPRNLRPPKAKPYLVLFEHSGKIKLFERSYQNAIAYQTLRQATFVVLMAHAANIIAFIQFVMQ